MPIVDAFEYTFDNLSEIMDKFTMKLGLKHYSLYLMDYGAPIGFRLATKHPARIDSLIIQNGNAYDEGIDNDFWAPIKVYWKDRGSVNKGLDNDWWKNIKAAYKQPNMSNEDALQFLVTLDATQWQYTNGVRDKETISPDNWHVTQRLLDRPGNVEIQLQLFYDYGSNPPLYPGWQAYFREHQPRTLIVGGQMTGFSRIPIECQNGCEPIPWDQVTEMRLQVVHTYWEIDLNWIWERMEKDLPALSKALKILAISIWWKTANRSDIIESCLTTAY